MTFLPVPNDKDWANYKDDVDATGAYELFFGKTHKEMRPHFERNVIEKTGELRFMPQIPFRYYMIGFKDYIHSINISGDRRWDSADAANCFINLVKDKLDQQPDDIWPIMPELITTVEYIAKHQKDFGADEHIYGNFEVINQRVHEIYRNQKNRYAG